MVEPSKYRMYVWHVDEKRLLGTLGELQDGIREIVYASDGQLVLTGPHGSSVFIWDLHSYQCIGALPGHLGGITCIAVSNNSMLVASGTLDGTIYLWSLQDGRKLATLRGHDHLIRCLSFSSDNSLLFSADRGGQALLWRIHAPLRPVLVGIYRTPHMLSAVHWHDARRIVVADSGREQSAPHFYHLALEGDWEREA